MSNDITRFKKYKKAKLCVEHLQAILKVIDLSIRGLSNFEVYVSVHRILNVMRDEKRFLEAHLKEQKSILESKGK